jgi:hypothetical protein
VQSFEYPLSATPTSPSDLRVTPLQSYRLPGIPFQRLKISGGLGATARGFVGAVASSRPSGRQIGCDTALLEIEVQA